MVHLRIKVKTLNILIQKTTNIKKCVDYITERCYYDFGGAGDDYLC